MRTDANKISLKAIRNLFSGARAFELEVGGTRVACSISPAPSVPWPPSTGGLAIADDGPEWPAGVIVDCTWTEGHCRFVVDVFHWTSGRYLHDLCVRLRTDKGREVVFVNVTNELEEVEDGSRTKLGARFFVTKRKSHVAAEVADQLNLGMRDALKESKLPIISDSSAELCEVEVPSGALLPSPDAAFRRLIHLALLKLEFIDHRRARERGKPLIDLSRWLTTPEQLEAATAEDDEESDEDIEDEGRQYWAGGFTEPHRLEKFLAGDYWKIGWARDSDEPAAKRTWKRFARIRSGDYFAIKGLGGTHDLHVRYVGEVVSIDPDEGRLGLRRLDVPLYKGKGPIKRGAGNWHDTIVPIARADIISMIFGAGAAPPEAPQAAETSLEPAGLPLNLILYGPPGTGKTYRITQHLMPRFQRPPAAVRSFDSLLAISDELTWCHAVAVAMHQFGGEADLDALVESPLLKAKYAAKPIKVTLRNRIWSVLGSYTVDGSKTVGNRRRFGDKLFDKRPGKGSRWFLAAELPEELSEIVIRVTSPVPTPLRGDHAFVTFHQAYGYEDFIEGIRPVVDDVGDDEASALSYRLEDGLFMKAALAALALAGYEGTIDQFCSLPRAARRSSRTHARTRYLSTRSTVETWPGSSVN